MTKLGCATHTYTITDRGGGLVTSQGVLTFVEYTRLINDASSASVTLAVSDRSCCATLSGIRSWRHTLNIYRGQDFVWSGFVVGVNWSFDQVEVSAVDIIGLLDRRVPHQNFDFNGIDLSEIARELINDGLRPDDPGHEVTVIGPARVLGGRTYEQNVGQTADHLRDLSDTGIDFTAVGNNIVILPDGFCEVVGHLTDSDLPSGLTVSEDGAQLATRQVVAGSEESGAIGTAGGINDYYGLLELYDEKTSITDQTAADAAAAAKLRQSAVAPVFIDTQNVTLSPNAAVDVATLVPGWCIDVTTSSTCRDISQRMKITGLQVSEDGGTTESPGQEKVIVQVAATGNELVVN